MRVKSYEKHLINISKNKIKTLRLEQVNDICSNVEKSVRNLRNHEISNNVMQFLSLDGNFAMNYRKKEIPIQNFISGVEAKVLKIPEKNFNLLRSDFVFCFKQFLFSKEIWDPNLRNIEFTFRETTNFLKSNPDIF